MTTIELTKADLQDKIDMLEYHKSVLLSQKDDYMTELSIYKSENATLNRQLERLTEDALNFPVWLINSPYKLDGDRWLNTETNQYKLTKELLNEFRNK